MVNIYIFKNLFLILYNYFPFLFLLASTILTFSFIYGLAKSYFFQDQHGELIWKSALIGEIILLSIGLAIKAGVLFQIVPIKPIEIEISNIPRVSTRGTPLLPYFGSSGIPDFIVSLILGIGAKLITAVYNGFLRNFFIFTSTIASHFLASNIPYNLLFSYFSPQLFGILSAIFIVLLVFRLVHYALATAGVASLEEVKIEIVNLFLNFLKALLMFVFIIFLFRLVQLFMYAVVSILPQVAKQQGLIAISPLASNFAQIGGNPKYGMDVYLDLKIFTLEPVFRLLELSIEMIKDQTPQLPGFWRIFQPAVSFIFKFKYDWEFYLALGMLVTLTYQCFILFIVSLKRIIWSLIVVFVSPIMILLRGSIGTAQIGETFLRDAVSAVFAPLVISILYVFLYYFGLPKKMAIISNMQGLTNSQFNLLDSGSFGFPDLVASIVGYSNELEKEVICLIVQICIGLVFIQLLQQLPYFASGLMSLIMSTASNAGGVISSAFKSTLALSAAVGTSVLNLGIGIAGFATGRALTALSSLRASAPVKELNDNVASETSGIKKAIDNSGQNIPSNAKNIIGGSAANVSASFDSNVKFSEEVKAKTLENYLKKGNYLSPTSSVEDLKKSFEQDFKTLEESGYQGGYTKAKNTSDLFKKNLDLILNKDVNSETIPNINDNTIINAIIRTGNELGLTNSAITNTIDVYKSISNINKSDAIYSALSSLVFYSKIEEKIQPSFKALYNATSIQKNVIKMLKDLNSE